jgi:predicted NBD/HSP70 family sugar kinase
MQATGLNAASVSQALRYLLDRRVILKAGEQKSNGGRKREVLKLNDDTGYLLAIDLEGSRIRFGLSNFVGDIRYRWEERFEVGRRLEIDTLRRGSDRVLRNLTARQVERVLAVGISYPGVMDSSGRVTAVNLGWDKFPFRVEIEKAFDIPVFSQTVGHICVEAEQRLGQVPAQGNWLFVIDENGIGIGTCVTGEVRDELSGELGHCTIDAGASDQCNCGKRGCLESIASGPNIVRQYLARAGSADNHGAPRRAADVFARARRGDEAARAVVDRAGRALGLGLSHAVNLLAPERIIFGGDIISGEDLLLPIVKDELFRHALPELVRDLKLTVSGLGLDIRLKGAAAYAFRQSVFHPRLLQNICDAAVFEPVEPATLVPS